MSTATTVPETYELEGDDALETLRLGGWGALVRDSLIRFRAADGFSHSRALAFQFTLALFPGLIALVGFARTLDQERFSSVLEETLGELAPGPASEVLTEAFRHGSSSAATGSGRTALALGLLASLIAGMTAMGQIERGANRIYGIERDRMPLPKYLLAFLLACSAGVLIVVSCVVLVAGSAIGDALRRETAWSETIDTLWAVGRWPLAVALFVVAVALVFKACPHRRQPAVSWLALGSTLSVSLWVLFTVALAIYVSESREFGETYGPLAGIIGVLIWAFLSSLALFLGLAFAAQLEAIRAGVHDPRTADDRAAPPEDASGQQSFGAARS